MRSLLLVLSFSFALGARSSAQELSKSGVIGQNYVYATSPGGTTQLFASRPALGGAPTPIGASIQNVPSRWAHRRRTLGALETAVVSPERGVLLTPMGNGVGTGAIHLVDQRAGIQTALASGGNPAAYDLACSKALRMVFAAYDDGTGNTILRGYSYAALGALAPLNPPTLALPGPPAAYVNRIGVSASGNELHVPTVTGIHVVQLSSTAPHMLAASFVSSGAAVPTTNPVVFNRSGVPTWIVGTSTFQAPNIAVQAGYLAWTSTGAVAADVFGAVPSAPSKSWVPAVGTEELAVVGNGVDTYVYYLLREPAPGTFFVKPAAIGVVKFAGATPPALGTLLLADDLGEPFAIPAVHGTRMAFASSFGAPFVTSPPGGGEKIGIVYTPLDPLGAGSPLGIVGNPDPLGGRISTKGMDRPMWSRDGTRVLAATSHFPGAANPGIPGLEVLAVPASVRVDEFAGPHTVVQNLPFPKQSIVFPSAFDPSVPGKAAALDGLTFFGCVFNQGLSSLAAPASGEVGQLQPDANGFALPPGIPNFRAILPPTFDDVNGSLVAVPASFGARRTAFNFASDAGFTGLTMTAAIGDALYIQKTTANLQALMGVGSAQGTMQTDLPDGWITTTELVSL